MEQWSPCARLCQPAGAGDMRDGGMGLAGEEQLEEVIVSVQKEGRTLKGRESLYGARHLLCVKLILVLHTAQLCFAFPKM